MLWHAIECYANAGTCREKEANMSQAKEGAYDIFRLIVACWPR